MLMIMIVKTTLLATTISFCDHDDNVDNDYYKCEENHGPRLLALVEFLLILLLLLLSMFCNSLVVVLLLLLCVRFRVCSV